MPSSSIHYKHVGSLAGKGSKEHEFTASLKGVATGEGDVVCAVGDREVKLFDHEGVLVRRFTTDRPGLCAAFDEEGNIFVGQAGQVESFSQSGARISLWRDEKRLGAVTSIRFFGEWLLVADAKDRCIRRFDRSGKWVCDIGKDNRTKGFLVPNGCLDFSVNKAGEVCAANPAKHRIERYSLDGKLLGFFGRFGVRRDEDFSGCCNPTNMTLTPEGYVVVSEKAPPRVKAFTADGIFLGVIATELFDPLCKNIDLACSGSGRLYVIDTIRLVIEVFQPIKEVGSVEPGSAQPTGRGE